MDNNINGSGVIEQPKYCSHCGAELDSGCIFCSKCGAEVLIYNQKQESYGEQIASVHKRFTSELESVFSFLETNPYLDAELPVYIGTKKEFYINRFQGLKVRNKMISLCFPAMVLGPFWALYRKLFVPAIILFLLYLISSLFGIIPAVILIAVIQVTFSFFAIYIYMFEIERKIRKGKAYQGAKKAEYVKKVGDTIVIIPVLVAVVGLLLSIIILM